MPQPIDALYRLNVTFTLHGVNCINSFWLRTKPNSQSTSLQDEADRIVSDWKVQIWPVYKLACSNELAMVAAVCTCLNPLNQAQTVASYVNEAGSTASESLPSHCASVLSMYTAYAGRRVHGRLYIPGIPEIEASNSVVSNAQAVKLANIASILINRWGISGSSLSVMGGVYSRKNGRTLQVGPPPFYSYSPLALVPWTRSIVNTVIRTQRHRMRGRGI